jgi:adenine-specific DNA-methyltransferase
MATCTIKKRKKKLKITLPLNLNSDFQTIKNYYDNDLNLNNNLKKTSNDISTPIDCVIEMVNKVPEYFWKKKNIKILDPCCGFGNFPFIIYHKLLKYHTQKHILENILYFNDMNIERLNILKKVFLINKFKLNIFNIDFLNFKNNIKFDLIVANPPFAKFSINGKRASKNHNMITSFIVKSLELLEKNGYLLYITPDNFMSFSDRNKLIVKLTSLQIHHINIHTAKKKYFKKVGSSFVWYLIENTKAYKDINIEGIWKKKLYKSTVKSEPRKFIPLFYNKIIQSIIHKIIDKKNEKFKVETCSDLHKYTKKNLISSIEDEHFKFKLIHTPSQTVYACRPHKYQNGYKVFISTTTYYSTFIDNCGMTQSVAFIRCDSKNEADNIKKILMHPIYVFINNICRYGNFNNIRVLQQFPKCLKYDNIYKKFNITEEEIKFIEGNF